MNMVNPNFEVVMQGFAIALFKSQRSTLPTLLMNHLTILQCPIKYH